MKKNLAVPALAVGLVFLLASCSTTESNHVMDDGSNMDGSTHEAAVEHVEGDSHAMDG